MAVFNNILAGASGQAGGAGAYEIERSLRFNSSDSAYLSRTPASAGNRKTWTWAGWVKRSGLGGGPSLFGCQVGSGNPRDAFQFASDQLTYDANTTGSSWDVSVKTTQVFRDASAWYHIVLAVDTTQATAANRVRLYVNGSEVTSFASATYPSQNTDLPINQAQIHYIGAATGANYFDGYLADIHFIDGQALDPTSFGEFDANGVWQPKAYTGTYGTNGFHLPFSDNSTTAALGTDTSGAGNDWSVNNISVAAGSGNDSLVDTPTNAGTDTGVGGEVRGNYATLNPLANSGITLSNGNLDFTSDSPNIHTCITTFAVSSGKWYWELNVTDFRIAIGIEPQGYYPAAAARTGYSSTGYAWWIDRQQKYHNGSSAAYGASITTGDIIGVALDLDAGTLVFYKNNVSQGTAYSGITGTYLPAICDCSTAGPATGSLNFGQRPFAYTAPSGYKALCTANLDDPVVAQPSTVMDVALYTGNGTSQSITGLGFSPDFVWIKGRSAARNNGLYDVVRGPDKYLTSNGTSAEQSFATVVTSFDSNGFSVGSDADVNQSSTTYVGWTWDAGSSTVTNTDGSITSSVRANASAGFSIVTYTGNATAGATVGHGLNAPLGLYILKNRDTADPWIVLGSAIDSTGANGVLILNSTAARSTSATTTATTSTTFPLSQYADVNGNGQRIVAYCFAPVDGYSSFGSYTGNGSADGPFIYTGFRPAFVLIKNATVANTSWVIYDNRRNGFNETEQVLNPNSSNAEATYSTTGMDLLSNGFKSRGDSSWHGSNGNTVIYAAFAEHPFAYARAR